jgi:hypothetical protein
MGKNITEGRFPARFSDRWRVGRCECYGGGGGTSQDQRGSELLSAVARRNWANVKQQFWPVENALVGTLGGATLPQALNQANTSVNRAFDTQGQGLQLYQQRRGITPDAQTQKAMARDMDLARGSALVGAQNAARLGVRDRDLSTMAGSSANALQLPKPAG